MKLVRKASPLSLVACAAALVACQGDRSGQTTTRSAADVTTSGAATTVPGTGPGSSGDRTSLDFGGEIVMHYASATGRIATAHCDRALACSAVGPGKQYGTLGTCSRDQTEKVQDDLKCPNENNDIDISKLNACLQSVAQQDCSRLDSPIETIEACQQLC